MELVFSSEGVDSAAGRLASPLVEGRPFSLPIPAGTTPSPTRYCDLAEPYRRLARELSGGRLARHALCHLDPDLDPKALAERPPGWRAALGQWGAALGHLRAQGVGVGDVFLFWGLYRDAVRRRCRWVFSGPRKHCLFGWLAIGEVLEAGSDGSHCTNGRPWLADHPHARPGWSVNNAIFVAANRLEVAGQIFPGSGLFAQAYPLTAPDAAGPSDWKIPVWLDPAQGGTGLSCNPPKRWRGGRLTTAPRGQEFVADAGEREDAQQWLGNLLSTCAARL